MKAQIVAASLIGSVAASNVGHAGFHFRRNADACSTVYTTVYVEAPTYAPMPPAPPAPPASTNTTTAVVYVSPSPVPMSSSSCTEGISSSPSKAAVSSVYAAPSPSKEAKPSKEVKPSKEATPSKEVYTPPAVVSVPAVSTPVFSAPVYSAPVYSVPAKSSAAPSSKPSGGSNGGNGGYGGNGGRVVTNGNKWAMTYTPYTTGGQCKGQSEVAADVKAIAGMGFTTLRVYSSDCSAFENIAPACKENGLKMIVGVFLDKNGKGPYSDYANQQVQDIKNKAPKDLLVMVIVGNEAIYNKYTTATELGGYVDYVRKELQGAGFPSDIAITTTEPVDVWQSQGAALCSHIDVFTVQVHPFFTSKISASGAGDFALEQLELAASVCPEAAKKGAYISEIGWPHGGEANGNAIPGASEQKQAIKSILEKVGSKSCLFSFQDDAWKDPGNFQVEQKFGCASALS